MAKTYVIGDIHGGLKAVKQVLKRANITKKDTLIFMGDYVDGWSESAQVIDFLIELSKQQTCHFIYGNHDAYCFDWLTKGIMNSVWLKHGGIQTIESYSNFDEAAKQIHIDFFSKMKNYYVDDTNRLFIHAGYTSMHGPEKEHYATNYNWDRTLWETALAIHGKVERHESSFPKRLLLFSEIFIGHTPTINHGIDHPWQRANLWNTDTGAAFTGKLSILDIDSYEFWQSDPVMDLYPNEKGRNK